MVSSTSLHPHPFQGTRHAASGGALALELPRATCSTPEPMRTVEENEFFSFFVALYTFPKFSPNPPKQPVLLSPRFPGPKLACSDREPSHAEQSLQANMRNLEMTKPEVVENLGKI